MNTKEKDAIMQWVEARGIKQLLHFTRADNLESILDKGLMAVQTLEKENIDVVINDEYRYDGHEDSTSISISFPNYKMFYKYRRKDANAQWVVLGLQPRILWEKDCAFCNNNAANSLIAGVDIETKKNLDSLKDMFSECHDTYTREQMGIVDTYTTNPQAEVLVFDSIEVEYIFAVACEDRALYNKIKEKYGDKCNVEHISWIFSYRDDYDYWR